MLKVFCKKSKGFTLIELLVVIAIIGILAAIAIPKFLAANETARGAKLQADLRTIDSASVMYTASNGAIYSGAISGLDSFMVTSVAPPTGNYRTSTTTSAIAVPCTSYTVDATGRGICTAGKYSNNI